MKPTSRWTNWARTSSRSWCPRSRCWRSRRWPWWTAISTPTTQRALAEEYLNYLYSPEGQALACKHYYRAWDTSEGRSGKDVARLPEADLVNIDHFGGWAKAQPEVFWRWRRLRPDLYGEVDAMRALVHRSPMPGLGLSWGSLSRCCLWS